MSMQLEQMFNNFIDKKVPILWEGVSYPSLKPLGTWVTDFIARVEFLSDWLYNGMPKSFWISAFFFPQGFMTATLQTYARKTVTAIDALQFRTNLLDCYADAIEKPQENGVNIHGLYMQGAKWSFADTKIGESDPGVLFVEMPVIWLEPVLDTVKLDAKAYSCPLYKTSLRAGELSTTGHSTNFVLFMLIPSDKIQEYWIRRGVAMLCQLDD
jgi:dynein heavy chain